MKARGKEIIIIIGIVVIALIAAWYFLLFNPVRQELSDLDAQIESARTELSSAQQEVVKLRAYEKTAPQCRAEIVRLGKMLPESEGIPGLIIALTSTAKASGVTISSLTPGTVSPGQPYGVQALTLQVEGRFFDVEDFLYRLEKYVAFRNASFRTTGRILQVTQLTLQSETADNAGSSGGSQPLAVTIGLNAYLWGSAEKAAAPAPIPPATPSPGSEQP
jgi:Tfp pilus assembly protein PilO